MTEQDETPETVIPSDETRDESSTSLSRKVLSGVGIMAAGGFLALWIGPIIAPKLPAGMAPVAAWLAPGGEAGLLAVEALRAETDRKIDGISTISQGDVEAILAGEIAALNAGLQSRINAIPTPTVTVDTSVIEGRIADLERVTGGLRAELTSLVSQLADVSATGGEVSSETTAQIATYAAALEGLKAEIAALSSENAALSQKIEGVSVVANQQVAVAETMVNEVTATAEVERNATAIDIHLTTIKTALESGEGFATALDQYESSGGGTVPVALADASGGVATMGELRAAFPEAAHAAIRDSILESSGDGVFSSAGAFLRAQVASRSLTPQDGLTPDAVLSRAEAALKRDDLTAALQEIDALASVAVNTDGPMADWLAQASARQSAISAYETLASSGQEE